LPGGCGLLKVCNNRSTDTVTRLLLQYQMTSKGANDRHVLTVFPLEEHGGAEALQASVGQYSDAVSKQVGLVHEVSGKYHRPAVTFLLQYVPRLATSLGVHA